MKQITKSAVANAAAMRILTLWSDSQKMSVYVGRHQKDWSLWQSGDNDDGPPDHLIEQDDFLVKPFENQLRAIHFATVCLLDALEMVNYLGQFHKEFGVTLDVSRATKEFEEPFYVEEGDATNIFLDKLRLFLSPLGILDETSSESQPEIDHSLKIGIQFLETILENTATALHNLDVIPTSEPEVYNAMKKVIYPIFPSSKDATSGFFSTLKAYKPDILIPEIETAVEYKYADSEEKLKKFLGEIAEDVKGYTGDPKYKTFYAVIYVTTDFIGKQRFQEAWKGHQFPDHWKGVYVVGNGKPKSKIPKSPIVAIA